MLKRLQLRTDYRTGRDDLSRDFFAPCLDASTRYDRAVGFFRSSVFALIADRIPSFVRRGGHIRVICSPQLTAEDVEAINLGTRDKREVVAERLAEELDLLLKQPDFAPHAEILAKSLSGNN